MPVVATLGRIAVATTMGAGLAWALESVIGWDGRGEAFLSLLVGGLVGTAAYGALLVVLREPEVLALRGIDRAGAAIERRDRGPA